jgi:hypothetical protein
MSEPNHNTNNIRSRKNDDCIDEPDIKDPREKGEEHEYLFAPNASEDEINFCKSCSIESLEGSDPVFNANIQKEFIRLILNINFVLMIQLAIELESHIMLLAKFYKIIEFLIQRHQCLFIFTTLLNNIFNQ